MYKVKPGRKVRPDFDKIPTTLEGFKLKISENDQIVREDDSSTGGPVFRVSRLQTYNETRLAYYNHIQSGIALERMKGLGVSEFKFPNENDKHVILYKSKDVETNSRLLVMLCDDQEPGLWHSRVMDELNIHQGSLEDAIKDAKSRGWAILILCPFLNIWHPELNYPMSLHACNNYYRIRNIDERFRIPGHEVPLESIQTTFEKYIAKLPATSIDLFVSRDSTVDTMIYLDKAWTKWQGRIHRIALMQTLHTATQITNDEFVEFCVDRACGWLQWPDLPINTVIDENAEPKNDYPAWWNEETKLIESEKAAYGFEMRSAGEKGSVQWEYISPLCASYAFDYLEKK